MTIWPHPQDHLEGKVQQQQAFEGELLANKGRIDAVVESARELVQSGHHSPEVIGAKAKEIVDLWAELGVLSGDKGRGKLSLLGAVANPPPLFPRPQAEAGQRAAAVLPYCEGCGPLAG